MWDSSLKDEVLQDVRQRTWCDARVLLMGMRAATPQIAKEKTQRRNSRWQRTHTKAEQSIGNIFIRKRTIGIVNYKLKLLALFLILPLLTLAVTHVSDASADKGDGKSCANKHKSTDGASYSKGFYKLSGKMSKKQFWSDIVKAKRYMENYNNPNRLWH